MSKVYIIYGAPGSGKGTQANLLAEKMGVIHFDTGYAIEKKVHNPDLQDDLIIQREKKMFDEGVLCTPEWVAQIVEEAIEKIHRKGKGIVFSGSPRTLPETKTFIPLVEKLYNRENIKIIRINVKPETSIYRNSHRRVCKNCGLSLVYTPENKKLDKCPKCGGKLIKRVLDKPETIEVRLKEFNKRTEPIYEFLTDKGYEIVDIDGEPSVEEIHQDILFQINHE
ncbi:MAG: nucleoside monophosphate kinase [bacterium]